ncbi:MAG: DUF59 domain-containing protein [Gammaproteobacteria bacterium]|nr:DUF59 domain-containing protein [Gammaproteobacteria bacterium]
MKRVNFNPDPNAAKSSLMEQFHKGNSPEDNEALNEALAGIGADADDDSNPPSETDLRDRVIAALKTIYDPEIPVNIYDLGLIYRVEIKGSFAEVDMTLTTPGCPVAHSFPGLVERSVTLVPGIDGAAVELVWEPAWTQNNISEAARLELGLI